MNKTPVILYHSFCSDTAARADNFSVTWENFKKQMDYLHQSGFVAVSLEKLFAEIEYWKTESASAAGAVKDTRKKVVLTFDDGDISNYHFALPILKEKGFSATFFVTINEIGKENRMDWPMIYDLHRQGMGIGSHGLNHSFLTAHTNYTILNELLMSKQVLEKYIRKRVDFLSIPHGFYNKDILTMARDVGFKAVCVSDAGVDDFSKEDIFLLRRFTMRKHYNIRAFKSIVSGNPTVTVNASENIRTFSRKILGYQVYDRLRKMRHRNSLKPIETGRN